MGSNGDPLRWDPGVLVPGLSFTVFSWVKAAPFPSSDSVPRGVDSPATVARDSSVQLFLSSSKAHLSNKKRSKKYVIKRIITKDPTDTDCQTSGPKSQDLTSQPFPLWLLCIKRKEVKVLASAKIQCCETVPAEPRCCLADAKWWAGVPSLTQPVLALEEENCI